MSDFEVLALSGADGVTLSAERHGEAGDDLVMLLHGGGQSRSAWRSAAAALAEHAWQAVSIDLRGHGDSDWAPDGDYGFGRYIADMEAVIGALGGPAVMVGASLGGHVALAVAAERPDLVRAAVLADVTPWLDEAIADVWRGDMRAATQGFDTLEAASALIGGMDPSRAAQPSERLRRHLREGEDGRFYFRWDPRAIEDRFVRHAGEGGRFAGYAEQVTVPLLMMRAELSNLVTPAQVDRFREVVPHIETIVVPGIGHMLTGDSNRAYAGPVLAFLERLRATAD